MPDIVPRWEWRTFFTDPGPALERLEAQPPDAMQESDETYLLSPVTDANVKVRDGQLDIKALEREGPDHLQQWRPVLKAPFPLPSAAVHAACAALGVLPPTTVDGTTSREDLAAALATRGVRAVRVHKRRARYTLDGCDAELTEVVADGHPLRTVAIESADRSRVAAAVHALGLDALPNVAYPRALKALLGVGEPEE